MSALATIGPPWLWHPLGDCPHGPSYLACRSYNFHSGISGELGYVVQIIAGLLVLWRLYRHLHHHFECHEEECKRLGVHSVHGTPFRTCWIHHPVLGQHVHKKVPLHIIHYEHHKAREGVKVSEGK